MANSDSNGRVSMILPCIKVISGTHYVSTTIGHPLDCLHSVSVDRVSVSHTPWVVQNEDLQANTTISFVYVRNSQLDDRGV